MPRIGISCLIAVDNPNVGRWRIGHNEKMFRWGPITEMNEESATLTGPIPVRRSRVRVIDIHYAGLFAKDCIRFIGFFTRYNSGTSIYDVEYVILHPRDG